MLVPLPPKSHSATTPPAGSPGAVCSAVNAARESGISAAGTPSGARLGRPRSAPRSAPTVAGPQCAGTAITTGEPPPTVRAIASRASTSTCSPRCAEPSAATSGTGSPTRSTKPLSTRPGWLRLGFSDGMPTSGARSCNSVRTERRITGGRPTRAATRLVIPMDNPSESVMSCLTIAAWPGDHPSPLVAPKPLMPSPLTAAAHGWVRHRSHRTAPPIASW